MTQEEIDELNKEYELQREEDYNEYMKERFCGIELHKTLKYDTGR